MKNLRVAMLAPTAWRVPPRAYGPWELVTSMLTEGLVRRGVDVTLFATADSLTSAKLVGVCARPYGEDPTVDVKVWECLHIAEVFERARAGEFDLDPQPVRFPAAELQRLGGRAGGDDDPRFFQRADRAGVRKIQRARTLRRHQRGGPSSAIALRGDDPPRHPDGRIPAALGPADGRRLPAVLRAVPPGQGRGRGAGPRRKDRASAAVGGSHPGPELFRYARPPAHRRQTRANTSAPPVPKRARPFSPGRARWCIWSISRSRSG